jgi:hypothetical protein
MVQGNGHPVAGEFENVASPILAIPALHAKAAPRRNGRSCIPPRGAARLASPCQFRRFRPLSGARRRGGKAHHRAHPGPQAESGKVHGIPSEKRLMVRLTQHWRLPVRLTSLPHFLQCYARVPPALPRMLRAC